MFMGIYKGFPLIVLLLLISACAGIQKQDSDKAALHLRLGTQLLKAGQYPAAYRELSKAVELNEGNPVAHNQLALAYYARERFKLAEQHFKKALDIKKEYSDARNNLGRLYLEQGKYPQAIQELETVVNDLKYSEPRKAHINLGTAYLKAGHHSKALTTLAKALRLDRSFCPAHSLYGQTLYQMGEFHRAAKALDKATKICKNLVETRYYSALSHYRVGAKAQAIARLEELVAMSPKGKFAEKSKSLLRKLKN